jgi:hypothetical protein
MLLTLRFWLCRKGAVTVLAVIVLSRILSVKIRCVDILFTVRVLATIMDVLIFVTFRVLVVVCVLTWRELKKDELPEIVLAVKLLVASNWAWIVLAGKYGMLLTVKELIVPIRLTKVLTVAVLMIMLGILAVPATSRGN